jgi:MFS family permease
MIPQRLERTVLIALPLMGSVAILLFPVFAPSDGGNGPANIGLGVVGAGIVAFLAGIGYAGVMPLTITMAQRLLPHRTSLASGLMMGGAWSLAACGPPLVQWMLGTLTARTGSMTTAMAWCFVFVASLLAMSGLLGIPLGRRSQPGPKPEVASAPAPSRPRT